MQIDTGVEQGRGCGDVTGWAVCEGEGTNAWCAAVLSLILPCLGHVYIGKVWRFVFFFSLGAVLESCVVFFLGSDEYALYWAYASQGAFLVLAVGLGCYDTFRCARRKQGAYDSDEARPVKDPWLAVFLSLLIPGLGHMYLRRWFQGALWAVVWLVLPVKGVAGIVVCLVYRFVIAMLGYAAATQGGKAKTGSRRMFGLAFFTVGLAYMGMALLLHSYVIASYKIASDSMSPTLLVGDKVIVNKLYGGERAKPNTIVMFRIPSEPGDIAGKMAMKRVVAVGGETVQVKDGLVYVNEQVRAAGGDVSGPAEKSDEGRELSRYYKYGVKEPYVVPEGTVFVLGDNIWNSADSRYFGPVANSELLGKVVRIWFPLRGQRTL